MEINYKAQVEAILFTMGESVEKNRIAKALDITQGQLKKIVKEMQEDYAKDHRGIKIIELENSYQLCTKPELYETLIKVAKQPKRQVLTDVMMETLSIIAYKQPITKSEIERIRGVKSDFAVNKLVEYAGSARSSAWAVRPSPTAKTNASTRQSSFFSIEKHPSVSFVQAYETKGCDITLFMLCVRVAAEDRKSVV